jgi:hypothetical protein
LSAAIPAYNLEVNEDPTYVAQGVVVHNCREMNGKIIPVSRCVDQRDELMAAKDPEDVKTISPWVSAESIKGKSIGSIMYHIRETISLCD